MIELTEDQRQALQSSIPRLVDPQTKKTYVLVAEELYEQLQGLLAPACLPLDEQRAVLHSAGLRAGWDDPEMDVYDREAVSENQP